MEIEVWTVEILNSTLNNIDILSASFYRSGIPNNQKLKKAWPTLKDPTSKTSTNDALHSLIYRQNVVYCQKNHVFQLRVYFLVAHGDYNFLIASQQQEGEGKWWTKTQSS